jgi:hypothetical protein
VVGHPAHADLVVVGGEAAQDDDAAAALGDDGHDVLAQEFLLGFDAEGREGSPRPDRRLKVGDWK